MDADTAEAHVGWVVDPPTVAVCAACAKTPDLAREKAHAPAWAEVEPVDDRGLRLTHGLTCVACGENVLPGSRTG